MPFTCISNNELIPLTTKGISLEDKTNAFSPPSAQLQKHLENLAHYLQTNSSSPTVTNVDTNDESETISPVNFKYYSYDDFNKANFNSSKSFSILHFNIHSIQKHIDSLRTLLLMLESDSFQFDIIAISESKLTKNFPNPQVDITFESYHFPESIQTEASKGGVLLYVHKKHHFKPRNDLKV